jgi:hypothetical protein
LIWIFSFSFRVSLKRQTGYTMTATTTETSYIIDNCVITKFSTGGHRTCKVSWYENQIGRSAAGLETISAGSRLNDNTLIIKLNSGDITFEQIENAWFEGKIKELIV